MLNNINNISRFSEMLWGREISISMSQCRVTLDSMTYFSNEGKRVRGELRSEAF